MREPAPAPRPRKPRRKSRAPSPATVMRWVEDRGGCKATDGCWVAPDGICPHGCESWAMKMGFC